MLSRLTTDTTLLQTVMVGSVSTALRNMLTLAGGIVMLLLTSATLAGYMLIVVPLVVAPLITIGGGCAATRAIRRTASPTSAPRPRNR